jgi:hypothetical protein
MVNYFVTQASLLALCALCCRQTRRVLVGLHHSQILIGNRGKRWQEAEKIKKRKSQVYESLIDRCVFLRKNLSYF